MGSIQKTSSQPPVQPQAEEKPDRLKRITKYAKESPFKTAVIVTVAVASVFLMFTAIKAIRIGKFYTDTIHIKCYMKSREPYCTGETIRCYGTFWDQLNRRIQYHFSTLMGWDTTHLWKGLETNCVPHGGPENLFKEYLWRTQGSV